MSKPKAPPPPDPAATIAAQTASNRTTATDNATLNNVNQVTPYGNVTYDVTGAGPNGIPRWTQTTSESPTQQQLRQLEENQGIALGNLGLEQTGRVADILGNNYQPRRFDGAGATGGRLDIGDALGDYGGDVEARTRTLASRGLDDTFNRGEESLRTRLANQGINAGTDAFESEMQGFNKGKGDAYANAELMARGQAQSDRGQMLSELLGERGANYGEAQTQYGYDTTADQAARSNPLNEIIALASGVQTNPINPGQPNSYNIAGTDTAGITNQAFQNQMGVYGQRMGARNALLSGLASLGGAGITKYSDPRLKRDVRYSHTDAHGLRWWLYRYLWDSDDAPLRLGVMANEAPAHAVTRHASGFLAVNYGALYAR